MALAASMMVLTCLVDTLSNAYGVVLCVLTQERREAGVEALLCGSWHSRRISACFRAFAAICRR